MLYALINLIALDDAERTELLHKASSIKGAMNRAFDENGKRSAVEIVNRLNQLAEDQDILQVIFAYVERDKRGMFSTFSPIVLCESDWCTEYINELFHTACNGDMLSFCKVCRHFNRNVSFDRMKEMFYKMESNFRGLNPQG